MTVQRFRLNKDPLGRRVVIDNLTSFMRGLPMTTVWAVEVKRYVKPRTLNQNAALFGLAYDVIMESTGLSGEKEREKLHTTFLCDFFGYVDKPIIGRVPRRTTTTNERGERDVISTEEMAKFYDHIQRTALEYGICVPSPDPLWNNERMKA